MLTAVTLAVVGSAVPATLACGSSPRPASPSPGVERALERGQSLYDAQQYEAATEALMQAMVEAEAEDDLFGRAVCYIALTLCQLRLGNTQAAARMLGEASRIKPHLEVEQPNVDAAQLQLLFGRYHEAQAELAKAQGNDDEAARHLDAAERYYTRRARG